MDGSPPLRRAKRVPIDVWGLVTQRNAKRAAGKSRITVGISLARCCGQWQEKWAELLARDNPGTDRPGFQSPGWVVHSQKDEGPKTGPSLL
jgi:hypothetical protein